MKIQEVMTRATSGQIGVPAQQPGTAFLPYPGNDLDKIFSLHQERVVGNDKPCFLERRNRQFRFPFP